MNLFQPQGFLSIYADLWVSGWDLRKLCSRSLPHMQPLSQRWATDVPVCLVKDHSANPFSMQHHELWGTDSPLTGQWWRLYICGNLETSMYLLAKHGTRWGYQFRQTQLKHICVLPCLIFAWTQATKVMGEVWFGFASHILSCSARRFSDGNDQQHYCEDGISVPCRHSEVLVQSHACRSMTGKDGESQQEPESGAVWFIN